MTQPIQNSHCEVAVIGAGPYGLAVAAHLQGANIETRVFGETMSFWRKHMPKGMNLRSSLTASDLSDPKGALSFQAYAAQRGMRLTYPVPLEDFVSYGEWFQAQAVANLDTRKVTSIDKAGRRFCLGLEDGDCVRANHVVIATGLAKQEFRPAAFAELPADLVSHACEHDDLAQFRGKRVAVIGRGQSAIKSAAILNDVDADVELVSRGDIHWLGSESATAAQPKDLMWRLHKLMSTKSGVGPFPFNQLAEFPDVVRQLPTDLRAWFTARCLRPGATGWLKPRFAGVKTGPARNIVGANATGSQVTLQFDNGSAAFDHVLLATGYHIDISKLGILAPRLLRRIRCANGSPMLSTGFESTVRGLHFVGSSAVKSYGPLMRFVAGSGYAARHLTEALLEKRSELPRFNSASPREPLFAQGSGLPSRT